MNSNSVKKTPWLTAAAILLILTGLCLPVQVEADWDKARKEAHEAAAALGEAGGETAKETWEKTKEVSAKTWEKTRDTVDEAWEKGKQEAGEFTEKTREKIHEATAPAEENSETKEFEKPSGENEEETGKKKESI